MIRGRGRVRAPPPRDGSVHGRQDDRVDHVNDAVAGLDVSRDDLDRVFTLSKADFERITEVGLPQLAVETIKPTEQAPEDAQSSIAADDQWPSG